MKWPWERTEEERIRDAAESKYVQDRLTYVMSELRRTLDEVEKRLDKEVGGA